MGTIGHQAIRSIQTWHALKYGPVLLCFLCFAGQLAAFWPGIADYDTVNVYEQILGQEIGNWHPPIFAYMWILFLQTPLAGTSGPFILQICTFWVGISLFVRALSETQNYRSAYLFLSVAFIPAVFGIENTVIKDSQLTSMLVCATGIWGYHLIEVKHPKPLTWFFIMVLLLYALLVRSNAIFSVLPLVVAMAAGIDKKELPVMRMTGVAIGIFLIFLSTPVMNKYVFSAQNDEPERQVAIYDLAGISHFEKSNTFRGITDEMWNRSENKECYQGFYWDRYSNNDDCGWIFESLSYYQPIWTDWIKAIASHPLSYARHRLNHFNSTMRWLVPIREPRSSAAMSSHINDYGLGVDRNPFTYAARGVQIVTSYTPLGWPAFWFSLAISLLILAWPDRVMAYRSLVIALLISALGIMSSFLIISISSDLRYHHWAITAIAMAVSLCVIAERRTWKWYCGLMAIPAFITVCGVAARLVMVPDWPE